MDFRITEKQRRLQHRCRELAGEFAARSAVHDRQATHPAENYQRLLEEGFCELTVPKQWGGSGFGFLSHTLAFAALAQGCPSTAELDPENETGG
jgi:alkylation response protein AidB-like acyl-CoA dehydrogenase